MLKTYRHIAELNNRTRGDESLETALSTQKTERQTVLSCPSGERSQVKKCIAATCTFVSLEKLVIERALLLPYQGGSLYIGLRHIMQSGARLPFAVTVEHCLLCSLWSLLS